MNRFSTWVTVAMLTIFTTMVVMALGFPPNARFMPFVVGLPGIALCLAQLALDLRGARRVRPVAALPQEGDEVEFGRESVRLEVVSWLYFLGFIGGVLLFGFLLAAPVLVAVYLRHMAGVRWSRALLAAAGTLLVMVLVFEGLLGFQLFEGFIGGEILEPLGL